MAQKEGKIVNLMMRRGKEDPTGLGLFPNWAWTWPLNRRIIYNRASVDPQGNPWDPKRALIKWNPEKINPQTNQPGVWEGDVPDGPAAPMAAPGGKLPFIMKPDGVASIFGPGLADGPFPEHYEPLECPLPENPMSKKHRVNPAIKLFHTKDSGLPEDVYASCDPKYPYVCTTFRLTEHWQTGLMTRHCAWLLEVQPQMFVEMSRELAKEKGIKNGERVNLSSARGSLWAVAIVTNRLRPFKIMNQTVHQVAIPWQFGWQFPLDGGGGDSANLLTPTIGDANTTIPESKAFMINIEKTRGAHV
jgi:formate dehydrogenase major subunit